MNGTGRADHLIATDAVAESTGISVLRTGRRRREPRWAGVLGDGHPRLRSDVQRGNERAGLPAWREGNAVLPLVDSRSYLPTLAAAQTHGGDGGRRPVGRMASRA